VKLIEMIFLAEYRMQFCHAMTMMSNYSVNFDIWLFICRWRLQM